MRGPKDSAPERRRLVILGRWPAPGRCKRRLAGSLGLHGAAAIQARLTSHVVQTALQACGGGIELLVAATGLGPSARTRWAADLAGARLSDQGGGSLGSRLRRQVVRAHRQGVASLVMIGSDLPELEVEDLREAFRVIAEGAPLVLGPALDGGYWLIGMDLRRRASRGQQGRRCSGGEAPAVRLFAGAEAAIGWGGEQVLEQTLRAAELEGMAATLLNPRADLDRPGDLRRWR